jgi:hypothetical protein
MKSTVALLATLTGLAAATASAPALAAPPSPELMDRIAAYAAGFEAMRTRVSFAVDGRMETLDRAGRTDAVKEMKARIEGDGHDAKFVVLKYTEDGEDKTAEAEKKARASAAERKAHPDKKRIRIPMLAAEQPRYVFDLVEIDRADPSRVRIAFVPKTPADDAIEGSAWIDSRTGAPIAAGFKISKTPIFVDYVHFTVEFGAQAGYGAAVSKVVVDGDGGVLFFRKRFHGTATLSDYQIVP